MLHCRRVRVFWGVLMKALLRWQRLWQACRSHYVAGLLDSSGIPDISGRSALVAAGWRATVAAWVRLCQGLQTFTHTRPVGAACRLDGAW